MSNKSNTFKNSNKTQIGNFIVTFDNGKLNAVKITAVSGNWNVRYREDNPLYNWITSEIKTQQGRDILHLVFATWYAACNGVPDEIFLQDILTAYQNSVERMKETVNTLSHEADNQIIQEEKQNYKQQ